MQLPVLQLLENSAACMPAGVAISVFQNYAVLQRPLQPLLKALERVDWASFGLSVQACFSVLLALPVLTACHQMSWKRPAKHEQWLASGLSDLAA